LNSPPQELVRFGAFELNLKTRELRTDGRTVLLQEQPYRVLLLLIKRGGEVVTRDEIRAELWPDNINVNFEPSINAAIKNLRKALNDPSDQPNYIQTMQRQGYRLLVKPKYVELTRTERVRDELEPTGTDGVGQRAELDRRVVQISDANPVRASKIKPVPIKGTPRRKLWRIAIPTVAVAVILSGAIYYGSHRVEALTDKDSIVLSDFANSTGDPVFEDTLKQGLAIQLDQSPFLQLVSERKVNATLKLMGRPLTDPLTPEAAREVCVRTGGTVIVTGSINQLGSQYVVGVKALSCATGDVLGEEQAQAARKEKVLSALNMAAVDLRRRLGESLASLQRYDTPVEDATTPSLEALKAFALARRQRLLEGDGSSIKFYDRAIELDPNFAMAYQGRAAAYKNLNQLERARADEKRAYELRLTVSDRERLSIEGTYYLIWTGELEKAAQTYELWEQAYPRDYIPVTNLGFIYVGLGDLPKALRQGQFAMRLQPNDGGSYANLGGEFQNLNRLDEAESVYRQALERKIEGPYLLINLYSLAFLKGDTATMMQSVADAASKPGVEDLLLAAQADTEAWHGRFANARRLTKQAIDLASRNEAKETAAAYQALAALREVEPEMRSRLSRMPMPR